MRNRNREPKLVAALLLAVFTATLLVTAPSGADPLGTCEPPDAGGPGAPTPASNPIACQGSIDGTEDSDWYQLTLDTPSAIVAVLRPVSSTSVFSLQLVGPDGPAACQDAGSGTMVCSATDAAAGNWSVGVGYVSGSVGDYLFSAGAVSATPPTESPGPLPVPTEVPTAVPSDLPTAVPSDLPTAPPTDSPSPLPVPTELPTAVPSDLPTAVPSDLPTAVPSDLPTAVPSDVPTTVPSDLPTAIPSEPPSTSTCSDTDPPNDAAGATEAPDLPVCTGDVSGTADPADWYAMSLSTGDSILAALVPLTSTSSGTELRLMDGAGDVTNDDCTITGTASACAVVQMTGADRVWKLGVVGGEGSYLLLTTVIRPDINRTADEALTTLRQATSPGSCELADASGSEGTPSPLPWLTPTATQTACDGTLAGGTDTEDWYSFWVRGDNAALQVVLQPLAASADVDFELVEPCPQGSCPRHIRNEGRNGESEKISFPPETATTMHGVWTLGIRSLSGTYPAPYRLLVSTGGP